ncbi:DUF6482 family protein [Larsenimonas rhizosphaerae]|uniref:DUF6482 family protein n=1 Tax=Larsenimonas rhizosphaerae TaxID=2944682 RepID=A0AA42CY56_9GAMM|nr:DUF6482 family protein [Larsenimonas rhizosphaerae]MCM2131956.1 DUF6482 family protein [Larsenimonas rhizosphaerae]MCX2524738.1 DUF6482 family protein [Larsenimonas rhizosphaerae]
MTFDDFVRRARNGDIDELQLESMEGDIFLFKAVHGGEEVVLEKASGGALNPASVSEAKQLLRDAGGLESLPFYLVQRTAYDEMIGQPSSNEVHKSPMTLDSGA